MPETEGEFTADRPARAQRFPVDGVVQYRAADGEEWRRAQLVNVSQSGVLFSSLENISAGVLLELILELASPLRAAATVVRSAPVDPGWQIGARFDALSFVPDLAATPNA